MVNAEQVDIVAEFKRVLRMEGQAILDCLERFERGSQNSQESIKKAVDHFDAALNRGGKIVVTGLGKSGKIGQKIAATLCSTGSLAVFLHPTEGLHGDLGLISPKDAVLALSYTGNTDELVRLMPSIKSLRVPVIGIGGNAESRLAQQCDVWLDGAVESEACPHNLAPTTSTTLTLAIGDALAVALMQKRGFDVASFAQNHPGGALGKRLNLRVSDIMHSGDAIACVQSDAPIDEVLMSSTQKKLGAVLVGEKVAGGLKLLGIVTDGDIRRALQHREKFFSMKAQDVMTASPVSIAPDCMAQEALELMENRPSQISVLPVVDASGFCHGLVRLHDLVRSL